MDFEKFGKIPEKNPAYHQRLESWEKMERHLDESTKDEFDNPEEFEGGNIDERIKEFLFWNHEEP